MLMSANRLLSQKSLSSERMSMDAVGDDNTQESPEATDGQGQSAPNQTDTDRATVTSGDDPATTSESATDPDDSSTDETDKTQASSDEADKTQASSDETSNTQPAQQDGEVIQEADKDDQPLSEDGANTKQQSSEKDEDEDASPQDGKLESKTTAPDSQADEPEAPEADKETKERETPDHKMEAPTEEKSAAVVEDVLTEPKQSETSRPGTDQSSTSKKEKDKKDKKERKKEKKREKRRSRQSSRDETKTRSSEREVTSSRKHLEVVLLSFFQTADLENSGHLDSTVFWEILQSAELNLRLGPEDVAGLKGLIEQNRSGQINYSEFASQSVDVISSLYNGQPPSDEHWIELAAKDRSTVVSYNKQTGDTKDLVEGDVDLFGGVIENMFQLADVDNKGFISREEFAQMLQSEQMVAYLSDEDILQMQQYFDNIPEGQATYTEFYPLAKELILRVYRVKDPSESEWCQLDSPQVGVFWFNKFTGETRRDGSDDRQQEIAFLNQAYAEVEAVNFELEQYKQENKELQNALAQANEEQEAIASQLYETGHLLDEANIEIEAKERELEETRTMVTSKEREIDEFLIQRGEFEILKEKLEETENELRAARETIATRDQTVAERDSNISSLQRTSEAVTDKLKSAHGQADAKDSAIASLKHKLSFEQMQAQKYEKQVTELEERLVTVEQELTVTKQSLEEKTSALSQARKHLKNSRERTMELEKDTEKMGQTHEKLRSAECEIRTLKSFLTTKTAIVEKHKKELRETKVKVTELQEKDRRRAIILADVLEKTARQYQQQVGTSPNRQTQLLEQTQTPMEMRPASAPAFPPEGDDVIDGPEPTHSPRILKSYTMNKGATTTAPILGVSHEASSPHKRRAAGKSKSLKARGRSKTVPKLPEIHRTGPQQKYNTFMFPTTNDIRRQNWEKDQEVSDHIVSNPQCTCELCHMNASITLRPETGVTAQTGITGFHSDMDVREVTLTRQMRLGQRVVIRMKKSEYDLEPQQLTGIIKYIGKVDSEFVDNRIYVGVRLDEAVGDTDGLIKGKRYFTCPPKHGKLVRISSIIAVLPNKSVFYKPLQAIRKRSPYGGAAPKKNSTGSINVV